MQKPNTTSIGFSEANYDRCWFCGGLIGSNPFLVEDIEVMEGDLMEFCSRNCGLKFYQSEKADWDDQKDWLCG